MEHSFALTSSLCNLRDKESQSHTVTQPALRLSRDRDQALGSRGHPFPGVFRAVPPSVRPVRRLLFRPPSSVDLTIMTLMLPISSARSGTRTRVLISPLTQKPLIPIENYFVLQPNLYAILLLPTTESKLEVVTHKDSHKEKPEITRNLIRGRRCAWVLL